MGVGGGRWIGGVKSQVFWCACEGCGSNACVCEDKSYNGEARRVPLYYYSSSSSSSSSLDCRSGLTTSIAASRYRWAFSARSSRLLSVAKRKASFA